MWTILLAMAIYMHEPNIIAHRGGALIAPENTLAAFQKSADLGLRFFECDVRLSKDCIPIVMHDATTELYSKESQEVHLLSFQEIRKLDAGSFFSSKYRGEKIPSLKEVLDLLTPRGTLMLELKWDDPNPDLLVDKVLALLEEYPKSNIVIGSFLPTIVARLKQKAPHLHLIGIADKEKELREHLAIGVDHVALDHPLAQEYLVREFQEKNIEVWVWTVNSVANFHKFLARSVEGIITDDPHTLQMELPSKRIHL